MGNYSWLLFFTDNADKVTIDWSKVETSLLGNGYPYICDTEECATLEELANMLDDQKFFGYWDNNTEKKLIAINKALINPDSKQYCPRLYFEEGGWDRVHFIEFHPGTDNVYHGSKIFNIKYNEEPENASSDWFDTEDLRVKNLKLNIARDPCNWSIYKVEVTPPQTLLQQNFVLLLALKGLRHEEVIKDPKLFNDLSKIAMNMGNNALNQ